MNTEVGRLSAPKLYTHLHPIKAMTLGEVVASALANDRGRALWLIDFGAVYVDQLRATDHSLMVQPKNLVRIHFQPKRYTLDRLFLRQRVVFENDDFIVVDKPSGLPVHATLDNLRENLMAGFEVPVYITHRLDTPTSGLIVVAKTKDYQSMFNKVIAERGVKKIYQATTHVQPPLGEHRHYMRKSCRAPKEIAAEIAQGEEGLFELCRLIIKDSRVLKFDLAEQDHEKALGSGLSLSRSCYVNTVELLTGRTHQIRAQLGFLGAAIIGDEMYGGPPTTDFGLRASELSFVCPKSLKLFEFSCR